LVRTIPPATFLAVSASAKYLTIARANSKVVPGPRLYFELINKLKINNIDLSYYINI